MEKLQKKEILDIGLALEKANFEAYLVGGCLRDLLIGKEPKDWDVATNAKPEELQKLFPESVYENQFGTVGVKTGSEDSALKIVEITTYRLEGKYTDKRHPDEVRFAKTVEEDLSRRDFTINAMALRCDTNIRMRANDTNEYGLVDPYGGKNDLKNKIIRAVGNPEERFQEDALRMMRAVRFMAQLGFTIEAETGEAIKKHSGLLEFISKERVRDELSKLLMTENAADGIRKMQELGLLKQALPELTEGVEMGQNKHHIYSVFEHNVRSLDYAIKQNFPLHLRLASLLHDVGKPRAKRGDGPDSTFYGHQVVGEKMALEILDRLHFSREDVEKIALLVREHMFVYDPETFTDAGARRLLRRVGKENIDDLFKLREADRIGSGVPKAQPYRLRHLKFRVEKVSQDPISAKMLKVNGADVMREANIQPGPKIGFVLSILLEEVLDDPILNEKEKLIERIKALGQMEEKQLAEMAKFAKKSADEAQGRIEEEIKKKYFI
ncbi:MAG: CCA tRNA nucleotidyltransferase [Candidatus Harrisonbacteria bacterium]|nr:CCA tRNA nucleotidyltransferase [Candidatus Harrisonbacteria bacterium]